MSTTITNVRKIGGTAKALLVEIGGREVWVPGSVICSESELFVGCEAFVGTLVVMDWFAERESLGDEPEGSGLVLKRLPRAQGLVLKRLPRARLTAPARTLSAGQLKRIRARAEVASELTPNDYPQCSTLVDADGSIVAIVDDSKPMREGLFLARARRDVLVLLREVDVCRAWIDKVLK
jgi:hypothetical protein